MAKPGTGAVLIPGHTLAQNLVAAWLFNENTGSSITDYTLSGHTGTRNSTGSPAADSWWTTLDADHDPAFSLDHAGGENWVEVLDDAEFDFTGDFSVVVGFAADNATLTASDVLISKMSTDARNDGFTIATSTGAKLTLEGVATTDATKVVDPSSTPAYDDTNYHQVVLSYNSTSTTAAIYADAVRLDSDTAQGTHTTNATDIFMGRSPVGATPRYFDGYIFYVYIYNKALNLIEITGLFSNPYQMFTISGMHADMVTELESRPEIVAVPIFDFGLNSPAAGNAGVTLAGEKFSITNVASNDEGYYEHAIIRSGSINRGISDSSFTLPRDQAVVTVFDRDRILEQKLNLNPSFIIGSTATIKLASKNLTSDKWFTLFSGIVEEYSSPEPRTWRFVLRRFDLPLLGSLKIPTVQEYDWVNIPDDSVALPANVVYGKFDSAGTGVTGMIPTIYVDNSDFLYLISYGRISSLDAVYVDGTETAASNYTLSYVTTNGREWSVVDFTSDQGTSVITVDCEGVESNGDGSTGTVLTNSAEILKHILNNFVFGSWKSGSWLDNSSFIADEYFSETETFFRNKQIENSARVIDNSFTGLSILNNWCQQHQIPSFWTYDGRLAVRPYDHADTNIYVTSPYYKQTISPEPSRMQVDIRSRELEDSVSIDYLFSPADNSFNKNLTVTDPNKGYDKGTKIQLHWKEGLV